ncbi:MAG: transcription-repair coupling factor, partial [Steroidobacteraceae bacterium]|nr:transcription-repair coupling factor [Steroidobacteraceae bacterium]
MSGILALPLPDARRPWVGWHQLHGSASSLALAEAAQAERRPWLVVEPDNRAVEQRRTELAFFLPPDFPLIDFPDWEVLPYDRFTPHPELISRRLRTLARLPSLAAGIVLLSADTLLQRLPPRVYIDSRTLRLQTGMRLDLQEFRARLSACGYATVGQVSLPGEVALRGSLLDLYPMGADAPLRIDLLDEQIDSMRRFDPQTQRSLDRLSRFELLPARELPLDPEAIRAFRRRYRARFDGDPTRSLVYRSVSDGQAPAGIEFYLPLFFEHTAWLGDYLPATMAVAHARTLETDLERAFAQIEARFEERRHDREWPLLEPDEIALRPAVVMQALAARCGAMLDPFKLEAPAAGQCNLPCHAPPQFRLDARDRAPLAPLLQWLDEYSGRVLIAADSPGRREILMQWLRDRGLRPHQVPDWPAFLAARDERLCVTVAPDLAGLQLSEPPLTVLTENLLFGARARQERRRRRSGADPAALLRDLQTLSPGAPVVHEDYGVGRYVGLQMLTAGGQPGEFLVLEYQGGDRLYVPVHSLHRVTRYVGADADSAPWHRLGTDQWAKARRRAAEQARDTAAELLDLYARRQSRPGLALRVGELEYQAFANAFPFEETVDQADAIRAVLADLAGSRPMDRIVCGDVGFGKTEVAMRAAFVAALAGKQVIVLAPTTLLAQQHFHNFRDRFADWPVRIEMLSRFRSRGEADTVLDAIERGTVDIVIATHRLLHANVRPKDLGLVIVDEEHRFGVRDKERLKALRAEVHVLTLTATPIPRTLNMALGGLRELSLITTPPAERVAIKTFVTEWHDATLREAVLRELRRGGQVYFVHNEVRDIDHVAAQLARLVPEAVLRIGHGQMRERELERLMVDFYHRRFNLLLCTTIIESGIDVPTANTIIIDRADRLGLAQLHQLRGRVGRSHHRAYAYLLVPSRRALQPDALRRLEALEALEELGAGFALATQDLEIRGAGELLGERQSGELAAVGVT